jgi:hypothetical protein
MIFRYMRDIAYRSKNRSITDSLINPSMCPTSEKVHRKVGHCQQKTLQAM